MPVWLSIITTVTSCLITVFTFYLKVRGDLKAEEKAQKNQRKEEMELLRQMINEMQKSIDARLDKLELDMTSVKAQHANDMKSAELLYEKRYNALFDEVDEKRSASISRLHKRIDELEQTYGVRLGEKLARLEGSIDSRFNSIEKSLSTIEANIIKH